jgi:ABC-type multidrug transport system fused ATPase/permease subunit
MLTKAVNSAGQRRKLVKGEQHFRSLAHLVKELVLPYWKWLLITFFAMLVETVMGLAAPWPLKIVIDNVINGKHLPDWLNWMNNLLPGEHSIALAGACGIAMVLFTAIGGLAGYINNYFTESVAQYMANKLRRRIYHHLQQLSLAYYDTHQVGKLLSTITTDVNTIQDFVSSTLLSILVDGLTIVGMVDALPGMGLCTDCCLPGTLSFAFCIPV